MVGYWDEAEGVKSNSRMSGTLIIFGAFLLASYVVVVGPKETASELMLTCTAAGTLFVTIAGPAMYFIFKQKQTEITGTEQQNKRLIYCKQKK